MKKNHTEESWFQKPLTRKASLNILAIYPSSPIYLPYYKVKDTVFTRK